MGCHLYERVFHDQRNPQLAQKITGMLLDLGKTEVENVLNDSITLHIKIEEALNVIIFTLMIDFILDIGFAQSWIFYFVHEKDEGKVHHRIILE